MAQKDRKKTVAPCLRSERKDVSVEKKISFFSDNRIFTYKYVVNKQRIRIHILKQETEDIDPVDILDFLNQLQQNYAYHSNWNRFCFNCFNLPDQNITIFAFFGSERGRNSNVSTLL